jgi:aminopeptidase N
MYGPAWAFQGHEYSIATYAKPIVALTTLERVLGERTMMALMRTFFRRYQFAHPTTEDFQVVAEEVTGQDLGWFFDGLVYGDGVLNYAVTEVTQHGVTVVRQGDLVVPTEVLVTFSDGSEELVPWDGEEAEKAFSFPNQPPVRSAQVDPKRKLVIDVAWYDNGLSRRANVAPWLALVSRLVGMLQGALLGLGGPGR